VGPLRAIIYIYCMKKPPLPFMKPVYAAMPALFFCCLAFCGVFGRAFAGSTQAAPQIAFSPNLIILTRQQPADSAAAGLRPKAITADSAAFASPPARAAISGGAVTCEVLPRMPVDSVMLLVRHSQTVTDTLGVVKDPPYRLDWNCASVPDQDQTHLQFGYVLYCGDSLIVNAPPLPHRWSLDRGKRAASKKSYLIGRQNIAFGEFEVDGGLSKWKGIKGADIGGGAYFKMAWAGAALRFIARVPDSSITAQDFVELHIDMRRDRAQFPGINHRSIRFSPRTRAITFVGEFVDGAYARSDSAAMLIADEMDWKAALDSAGYTVEAAIPFAVLSDLTVIPPAIGVDVSVMNVDTATSTANNGDGGIDNTATPSATSFHSWSGAERFTRYSPKNWGTANIEIASLAIRLAMIALMIFMGIALIAVFVYLFLSHSQEEKQLRLEVKAEENSPITDAIVDCVDRRLSDAGFGIGDVLKEIDKTEEEVNGALTRDMDCTFEQLLTFRRIKRSQRLMRSEELSVEKIAALCGFADVSTYKEQYKSRMNVDPEISRAAMLERTREDMDAAADDDDDDDAY
jgi:AraC-like DNA-binding protein